MPIFARTLDVVQGFNFKRDKQTPVGHLLNLTIGGTTLRPDLTIINPEIASSLSAAGVLKQLSWSTVATDPISLTAQISAANTPCD